MIFYSEEKKRIQIHFYKEVRYYTCMFRYSEIILKCFSVFRTILL